jgi:hypothetical protein
LRVAKAAIGEYLFGAQASWNEMRENYRSENPPLEPTVALNVTAGGLEFTVSYVVDYAKRTRMKDQLFTKIIKEVANSNGQLEWASTGVTVVSQPAAPDAAETHPSSSAGVVGHAAGSH